MLTKSTSHMVTFGYLAMLLTSLVKLLPKLLPQLLTQPTAPKVEHGLQPRPKLLKFPKVPNVPKLPKFPKLESKPQGLFWTTDGK